MYDQIFQNPRLQTSQHNFARVPSADIPRSSFNRSHSYKTTFDAGYLVPFYVDEAIPGDTFGCRATTFARLATPIAPLMDNLYADVFFFAVPIRLVWNNFQKFMGEQTDPGDSTDYLVPTVTSGAGASYAVGSIHDYFGLPTGVNNIVNSALWHRAYNLIWNEWFRDENLQDSVPVSKGDGPDTLADYSLLRAGKRHDYFTSCLPWPQKGDAVTVPLGTSAPVYGNALAYNSGNPTGRNLFQGVTAAGASMAGGLRGAGGAGEIMKTDLGSGETTNWTATEEFGISLATAAQYTTANAAGGSFTPPFADLSSATAATINQLREAFQIQKLLERDARGGTRYTEIVRAHFGVVSPDARLQRPELLGLGSTPVQVSPVPQTSSTDATTPQGNLAAMGTFSHNGIGFHKSFTEHTLLLGLIRIRADLTYQEGLPRMFSRSTRYDFYWPALAHIGEQAVLNQEIYAQGIAADEGVFGYQERYAEYRYKPSQVTGKLRSNSGNGLDIWHLAQDFSALPVLGDSFIQENPPMSRVIAVNTEPHFIFDSAIHLQCARPMPVYSVPGLIDHF